MTNLPLRRCKPGASIYIQTLDWTEIKRNEVVDEIGKMIRDHYVENMKDMESEVNTTFAGIYGRHLPVKRKITSEILIKLKEIMTQTGKTITEITHDIRRYLGYPCSFFRFEGAKQLPIDSQRITKAYELIKRRASIIKVEDALYF